MCVLMSEKNSLKCLGFKYIRFVLALNVQYAYVFYMFTFALFSAIEHV